jgi:hypothetical protein
MHGSTMIALSIVCGALLGLALGLSLSGPSSTDAELREQLSALTRRLAELDARLASVSDEERIAAAVRSALAERDAAAGAGAPERNLADARRELPRARSESWTTEDSERSRSLLESAAEPEEVLPLARKAVRSLNP